MLRVLGCIIHQHDVRLVVLAGLLCGFACWTAVSLLWRAWLSAGRRRVLWTIGAGTVFGAGVWATHFIAMLAYDSPIVLGYDELRTVASILVAVTLSTAGFTLVLRGARIAGGAIAGAAISAMHYVGISAIDGPFDFAWEGAYVVASVAISVGSGIIAAVAGTAIRNGYGRALAAATFTVGIVGLHFTAMTALTLTPDPLARWAGSLIVPGALAIAVAAVALLVVSLGLVAALLDSHLVLRRSAEEERLRAYVTALEHSQTALEHTTADLRVALAEAATASQAKSAFLAVMSHELRTPLNAILGFSEILLGQSVAADSGRYREYLTDIAHSGAHLLELVNNILDLARADIGRIEMREEWVPLANVLEQAASQAAAAAAARDVHLCQDFGHDQALALLCDRRLVQRALYHLISNGVKFTPAGGEVRVGAHLEGPDVCITIADTGIGMAPENIAKAFERFRQVDSRLARAYEGVGLGLPLARQFIALHGGTLSLTSAEGEGTVATVRLPGTRLRTGQLSAA